MFHKAWISEIASAETVMVVGLSLVWKINRADIDVVTHFVQVIKQMWPRNQTLQNLDSNTFFTLLSNVYYWPCMCNMEHSFPVSLPHACLFAACMAENPYLGPSVIYCDQMVDGRNIAMIGVHSEHGRKHQVIQFAVAPSEPDVTVKLIASSILLGCDRTKRTKVKGFTWRAKRIYPDSLFAQNLKWKTMRSLLNSCQYLECTCSGLSDPRNDSSPSDDECQEPDGRMPPDGDESGDDRSTDPDNPDTAAGPELPAPPAPSNNCVPTFSHLVWNELELTDSSDSSSSSDGSGSSVDSSDSSESSDSHSSGSSDALDTSNCTDSLSSSDTSESRDSSHSSESSGSSDSSDSSDSSTESDTLDALNCSKENNWSSSGSYDSDYS